MPAKMARSAPRSPFGLPEATAVVRAASLSCQNEGKAPKFSRNRGASGDSRFGYFQRGSVPRDSKATCRERPTVKGLFVHENSSTFASLS